ncbi:hypothetical protein [Gordonia aichiensis]|uniref:hypothetical protein n=1 Tax=Gordonia aichiensis TaxID=36820 RepID=UPI0012F960F1|nr:hypothetical protein [Gordonia aichiensis]
MPSNRDRNRSIAVVGAVVFAALLLVVAAILVVTSSCGGNDRRSLASDPAVPSLTPEQYTGSVGAACRPGSYESPNRFGHLDGAEVTGFCVTPGGWPVNFGQYSDLLGIDGDLATPYVDSYAVATLTENGDHIVFMATADVSGSHVKPRTALEPLEEFGSTVVTVE